MSKIYAGLLAAATIFVCTIAPAAGQRGGGAADLPDGPGKDAVAQECTKCHGVNNITGSWGFTEKDWRETVGSLGKLPDERAKVISPYLRKNFPERSGPPETVVVAGGLKGNITGWGGPTLRSRPPHPQAP